MGNGAEVGCIEEAQDGARFRHSHQDVELIREGLSQSRNHRAKACNQSVKAGLTTRAGAQRGQKVQHRLHSQMLQGENIYQWQTAGRHLLVDLMLRKQQHFTAET